MIWIQAEDSFYYDNIEQIVSYLRKANVSSRVISNIEAKAESVIQVFIKTDAYNALNNRTADTIVISPFSPTYFKLDSPFFGVIKVPNYYGLLTKSEKESGLTEYEKLEKESGLIIEKSPFTFKDMAGSENLLHIAKKMAVKYSMGENPDATFLAGIMGTGKSFYAFCFAGETDRFLVSFNLTKLMYKENPIETFDNIISYLQKENKKYLLWIDEIEKMFTVSEKSEHMKNKFLTFLNDLGNTLALDAFVVMTANDVSNIFQRNPEMIRGGRVEPYAKVFLDFLTPPTAIKHFKLHIDKRNSLKHRKERVASLIYSISVGNQINKDMWIYEKVNDLYQEWITKEEYSPENKNYINDCIDTDERVASLLDEMIIAFDAERISEYIERSFAVVCKDIVDDELEGFPYVPSEIKELVTQLFYTNLEERITEDTLEEILDELMRDNLPIAVSGKSGIAVMKGNQDKFSIIIN